MDTWEVAPASAEFGQLGGFSGQEEGKRMVEWSGSGTVVLWAQNGFPGGSWW